MGPSHWRKAFCLFSLIWAFVSCATSCFLCLLPGLRLVFVCFFFLSSWTSRLVRRRWANNWKCSFLQENHFVALSSSIFVEIQKLWFSTKGIFLRDVIFFNVVTIVKFCLKNLLSEKHWPQCVEVQILKVLGDALCLCFWGYLKGFSLFCKWPYHRQTGAALHL